jgi:hypothetical protein
VQQNNDQHFCTTVNPQRLLFSIHSYRTKHHYFVDLCNKHSSLQRWEENRKGDTISSLRPRHKNIRETLENDRFLDRLTVAVVPCRTIQSRPWIESYFIPKQTALWHRWNGDHRHRVGLAGTTAMALRKNQSASVHGSLKTLTWPRKGEHAKKY